MVTALLFGPFFALKICLLLTAGFYLCYDITEKPLLVIFGLLKFLSSACWQEDVLWYCKISFYQWGKAWGWSYCGCSTNDCRTCESSQLSVASWFTWGKLFVFAVLVDMNGLWSHAVQSNLYVDPMLELMHFVLALFIPLLVCGHVPLHPFELSFSILYLWLMRKIGFCMPAKMIMFLVLFVFE